MSQVNQSSKTTIVNAGSTQIIHANPAAAPAVPDSAVSANPNGITISGNSVTGTTAGVVFNNPKKS